MKYPINKVYVFFVEYQTLQTMIFLPAVEGFETVVALIVV